MYTEIRCIEGLSFAFLMYTQKGCIKEKLSSKRDESSENFLSKKGCIEVFSLSYSLK